MMDNRQQDIIERLRDTHVRNAFSGRTVNENGDLILEAADRIEQLEAQLADAKVLPERKPMETHGAVLECKTCGGSGYVDDGEIDCWPNGMPFENGPVKCVKDCPQCKGAAIESTRKG